MASSLAAGPSPLCAPLASPACRPPPAPSSKAPLASLAGPPSPQVRRGVCASFASSCSREVAGQLHVHTSISNLSDEKLNDLSQSLMDLSRISTQTLSDLLQCEAPAAEGAAPRPFITVPITFTPGAPTACTADQLAPSLYIRKGAPKTAVLQRMHEKAKAAFAAHAEVIPGHTVPEGYVQLLEDQLAIQSGPAGQQTYPRYTGAVFGILQSTLQRNEAHETGNSGAALSLFWLQMKHEDPDSDFGAYQLLSAEAVTACWKKLGIDNCDAFDVLDFAERLFIRVLRCGRAYLGLNIALGGRLCGEDENSELARIWRHLINARMNLTGADHLAGAGGDVDRLAKATHASVCMTLAGAVAYAGTYRLAAECLAGVLARQHRLCHPAVRQPAKAAGEQRQRQRQRQRTAPQRPPLTPPCPT